MLWYSFKWIVKGLSHIYTCIHSPLNAPSIQSATWHWAEFHVLYNRFFWLSILNIAVYIRPSQSLNYPFPHQQPWVHFLSLWVSFCFVSKFMYTLLYLKCITNKTYCIAHGTLLNVMCQPGWERGLGENGYMYMYGWVPSLFIWSYHNIVSRLYAKTKCFLC